MQREGAGRKAAAAGDANGYDQVRRTAAAADSDMYATVTVDQRSALAPQAAATTAADNDSTHAPARLTTSSPASQNMLFAVSKARIWAKRSKQAVQAAEGNSQ